jgi:hypothetical protein
MRKVEMIVTNEEQLKNSVIVYSIIIQWMREAGEDFIDTNESFIKGELILEWVLNKEIITKDKYDYIIENDEIWIQDLLLGYKTGLLNGGCRFPSNNKAYQIIAEYISESKELREGFIYNFCTSFNTDNGDKSRGGMSGSYDADDGLPICSHILEYDLQLNTMTKEEWLKQKWNADISFTDEYNYLKEMSFEEADKLSKELDK